MRRFFVFLCLLSASYSCAGSVGPCDSGGCGDVANTSDSAIDVPVDATAPTHALGAPCTDDLQCDSGICLPAPIGRCTVPCMQRHDCPSGNNWSCSGVPGRGNICACDMRSAHEVGCNGLDDDCDGLTDPHSQDCNGLCTDLWSNNTNCGACGIACTGGSVCIDGMCNCPSDRPDICGTSCVNLQTDPTHCGTCTTACPAMSNATATCSAGTCDVACIAGFGDCNHSSTDGCETDVRADIANCGMCGQACSFANAAAMCATGNCLIGACSAGYSNCDGSSLNGCEAQTGSDIANCGACGRACNAPHAMSACSGGACSLATCVAPFANCNAIDGDGCEINLQTDVSNCGACGGRCPGSTAPHTAATCTSGTCSFVCTAGFADCDGNANNGCETDINTASHCGSCARACPTGQFCSSGTCACGVETCNGLDDDCDGVPDDGLTRSCALTCGTGTQTCSAGSWGPCVGGSASSEVCDGVDNDCDGMIDEDLGTTTCGVGACMRVVPNCIGGIAQVCTPGSPRAEECNAVDDDCNGSVDDNVSRACTGCGVPGTQTCGNGIWSTCSGSPAEVCDGVDNDCDGVIDDNIGTIACGVGACARVLPRCVAGVNQTCTPGTPLPEDCNGIDDDCNGVVDDGASCPSGTTCSAGRCS